MTETSMNFHTVCLDFFSFFFYHDVYTFILLYLFSIRDAQKMLTCVVMPRLPRNALVEWHAIATQQLPKSECKLPLPFLIVLYLD